MAPIARRLRVPDRLHRVSVRLQPRRRGAMQRIDDLGGAAAELELQQVREQVVVAEPAPPGVERDDERVRVLEVLQDRLRAHAPGQGVGERTVDPLEHGGAQEQLPHVRRLTLEHLRQQVSGDGPLAAGELRDEPLGIGVPRQRDRREPQTGRPPLGPLPESRRSLIGQRDPARLEQPPGLLEGEAQVGVADIRQRARQPQAVQPEARVLARREHDPQRGGQPGQEALEQPERLGRAQLMQIVDDQDDGPSEGAEVGQQVFDDRLAGEGRRRRDPLHPPLRAGRGGEGIDHREPEPLRVPLAAVDRHPRDRSGGCVGLHPGAQQRGLAATGRRAQDDDLARPGARQPVEQQAARHEAVDGRGSAGFRPWITTDGSAARTATGRGARASPEKRQVQTPGWPILGGTLPATLPPPAESRKARDDSPGRGVGSGA